MKKRLYKSIYNRKIFGVCAGVAEYFDIDVSIVRIVWLAVALIAGSGILIYIICGIVLPNEDEV